MSGWIWCWNEPGCEHESVPLVIDLFDLVAELVDIGSESHHEAPLVDHLETLLAAVPGLALDRIGDNLVARTELGRSQRLMLAGHTDTVPANNNAGARRDGDVLWGLGTTDMKGGLAVMVDLARTITDPAVDVTYVFYAREEVAAVHSGLEELFETRPDLLVADVALLGEPTDAVVEAGCQGTLRYRVELVGERAHTARAWMGRNAIHRLGPLLADVAAYEPRQPVMAGCRYHEGLQAVAVDGGVAGNVVPDRASVTINHRFAPDRSPDEATAHVREILEPHLGPNDSIELTDLVPAASPGVDHPLLSALIDRNGLEVRAKLGWTDVARLAGHGIPAANFGPGDATLAHMADERLERQPLEAVHAALGDLLSVGVDSAATSGA